MISLSININVRTFIKFVLFTIFNIIQVNYIYKSFIRSYKIILEVIIKQIF